jgi:hypothetical protein
MLVAELPLPTSLQVDADSIDTFDSGSIQQSLLTCRHHTIALWEDDPSLQISLEQPDTLRWHGGDTMSRKQVFDWLEKLPFQVAFGGKRPGWPQTPALLPGQFPPGWLIAFKGEGHRYLVSQRWLDYAPVLVEKRGDMTLVQLHDLNADDQTALQQAEASWLAMGNTESGGFLPRNLKPKEGVNGIFDPEDGSMSVLVVGRDPTLRELQEACVARNFRGAADGSEIKKIVYLFSEPERAEKHIYDLWLRGIECHAFLQGKEVNLSAGYQAPQPEKIPWIK